MEATTMKKGLLFELSNGVLAVAVATDGKGGVDYLDHTLGKGPTRRFTGDEISVSVSDEGTFVKVFLETGAADGPIVRFTVVVPPIVAGDENTFKVSAAALTSTQNSQFGGPQPGPQVSYDATDLPGTVSCAPAEDGAGTYRDY